MGDFLRVLLDSISYLWPFAIVNQYERGVYYVLGRRVEVPRWYGGPDCRPGRLWVKVPFFTELRTIIVVRNTLVTPLQTITCQDGGTLTFSASAQVEVDDADAAYNKVSAWEETTTEDIAAALAEKLAETPAARLEPGGRGRLVGALRQSLQAQVGQYGVRIVALRFNNFVRNVRVYRLFNDQLYNGKGVGG
jgi:regulator of protease activity HflC (stomatin/prohibitin superfamily)